MKARVKSLLAEYEIGFVTHGKGVNEHLKKFESALDTLFTEQMKKVIGEDEMPYTRSPNIAFHDGSTNAWEKYDEAMKRDILRAEQRQRLEESRKELFDE